jgi:hypothetical protein
MVHLPPAAFPREAFAQREQMMIPDLGRSSAERFILMSPCPGPRRKDLEVFCSPTADNGMKVGGRKRADPFFLCSFTVEQDPRNR